MRMKTISYAFFVTEVEYPGLQAACPRDFPFSYVEFCTRVNQNIQEMAESVAVEKVYVNVDEFLAWCADANIKPNNISRARYAIVIGNPWGAHE